jgi:type VI secretion system protein ImpM
VGQTNLPGFYGKLPELGDFVNRRLPRPFMDRWDEWLQNAIAVSRRQLGDAWLNLYLSGPVWRFILSGGLCSEQPWCGLLMPSVDRVGRYFPLTIAAPLPLDANLVQVALDGHGWFDAAEEVILGALDEKGFNLDDFDYRVASLGDLTGLAHAAATSTQTGYGSAWQLTLDPEARLSTAMPIVMHQLVLQRLGAYSLWWSSGSVYVPPSMLITAGMPPAPDFVAMLNGDWANSSWEAWPMQLPGGAASDEDLTSGAPTP